MTLLQDREVHPLGNRQELRAALSMYAEFRFAGPLKKRWDGTTWNLHMGILSAFYRWAVDEHFAEAVPFTYRMGKRMADGVLVDVERNLARVRSPRPHTSIKYMEQDFCRLFVCGLAGLEPDGTPDRRCRGRECARNGAMGDFVLASGLRRQEFTHLTIYEVPPLPRRRSEVPILFPLSRAITKGRKARTTWVTYGPLARMHQYIDLDRAASAEGYRWRPPWRLGEPILVEAPDWEGATLNGRRRPWRNLTLDERLCLVTPEGQSPLVSLQSSGKPFIDWATVFRRTSARIRERFEPRFPTVSPHRCRHSFAMATLEGLVKGHYRRASELTLAAGEDAALALYLMKNDQMLVLRDLLGHTSVLSTELYIARLDVTRIYRDAYRESAARMAGPVPGVTDAEVEAEFTGADEEDC
ncbi:site-specific integrase [Streptomyces sp. NPDC058534]|uniref:site-specific integrase n=1 Tax=Streptomyces sp. NPDC058534 TaxID=3346541 RepID=UPI00365229A7